MNSKDGLKEIVTAQASVASENLRQLRPVVEQVASVLSSETASTREAIGHAEQERLEARQNLDFILKRLNWK